MDTEDILVGGEEAGGMGFKNYIPERDGILAGLLLLEMMAYRKKGMPRILAEMEKKYGRYYYVRSDMKIKNPGVDILGFKDTKEILGKKVTGIKDYDGIKIMRVYAESASLAKSKRLLALGEKMVLALERRQDTI
jgi:phosphomannomutase